MLPSEEQGHILKVIPYKKSFIATSNGTAKSHILNNNSTSSMTVNYGRIYFYVAVINAVRMISESLTG
jgi:hypothetical protein